MALQTIIGIVFSALVCAFSIYLATNFLVIKPYIYKREEFKYISSLLYTIAGFLLINIGEILAPAVQIKTVLDALDYAGYFLLAIFWFLYASNLGNNQKKLSVYNVIFLIIVPSVLMVIICFKSTFLWSVTGTEQGKEIDKIFKNGYWLFISYIAAIGAGGLIIFISKLKAEWEEYRAQVYLLGGLTILPITSIILSTIFTINPLYPFDPVPLILAVSSIICVYLLTNKKLYDFRIISRDNVFHHLDDIIVIIDIDLNVIDFNKSAKFSLKDKAGIQKTIDTIFSDRKGTAEPIQKIVANNELVLKQDGVDRTFDISISALPDDEKAFTHSIISLRDITDRKHIEAELEKERALAQDLAKVKEELLREVNHRVGNNLATLISLINLGIGAVEEGNEKKYGEVLEMLSGNIRGLSILHQMLQKNDWEPVYLHELIENFLTQTLETIAGEKQIAVQIDPSDIVLKETQAHRFALIINELSMNTIKHAFKQKNKGKIQVGFQQDPGKKGHGKMVFQDDGPGFPREVLEGRKKNLGLEIVNSIVASDLTGSVELKNENGAKIVISFKVE